MAGFWVVGVVVTFLGTRMAPILSLWHQILPYEDVVDVEADDVRAGTRPGPRELFPDLGWWASCWILTSYPGAPSATPALCPVV